MITYSNTPIRIPNKIGNFDSFSCNLICQIPVRRMEIAMINKMTIVCVMRLYSSEYKFIRLKASYFVTDPLAKSESLILGLLKSPGVEIFQFLFSKKEFLFQYWE